MTLSPPKPRGRPPKTPAPVLPDLPSPPLKTHGPWIPNPCPPGIKPITIEIDGTQFTPIPGVRYPHNYATDLAKIQSGEFFELDVYRNWIFDGDLFFILFFILKMPEANHPFVIEACREVQLGPKTQTLDVWAREHYKSSLFTKAELLSRLLCNPEERIAIMSYSRAAAKIFLGSIKYLLEQNEFLKTCFPDILYANPAQDAPKWGEEAGLYVKRNGYYNEASVEAWGLIEGMPTGRHFTWVIYDDIETLDLVNTPELIEKVKAAFDMSLNIGEMKGGHRVVGTYYHHDGPLMHIKSKKREDGTPIYLYREKRATDDGTASGHPLLLPVERFELLKSNTRAFYSQQLCDPTPLGSLKLEPSYLQTVTQSQLPSKLYRFMIVDPAGERRGSRIGDCWGIAVIGVVPMIEEKGTFKTYILDLCIEEMAHDVAIRKVVEMYCRGGRILALGVEKVAMNSSEIHIQTALRAKKKHVTVDNGGLVCLSPAGRSKAERIEAALMGPLNAGMLHIVDTIPAAYAARLRLEMEQFPFGKKDDGLDSVAYLYDLIKDYRFSLRRTPEEELAFLQVAEEQGERVGWMMQ